MKYIFLDRSSPKNIKITPHHLSSQKATVEWSFPGDISELCHFTVKAETDEEPNVVELTIHDVHEKKAILSPLRVSSNYTVTVTAVYSDGIKRESSAEFFSECGQFIQQLQCVCS